MKNEIRLEIEGKVKDLILELEKYPNADYEIELDYGSCFYEGDPPAIRFFIKNVKNNLRNSQE